jgi:D-amino-acid dehydrogenase
VVGLACAWYLQREGAETIVLERDRVGEAASLGNAGWITPALSNPLASPGVVRTALHWMLKPGSPFLVRPRPDPEFARWCLSFWRSTSRPRYLAGIRALLGLNRHTLELYDGLVADGVSFEMHSDGLLFLFRSLSALDEEIETLKDLRNEGYGGEVRTLTSAEARAMEPAVGSEVVGAIHTPAERYVRPETLTTGLATALRSAGSDVREDTEVAVITRKGGGWRLSTSGGEVDVDKIVVAAGAWTGQVLAPLGVRIPQEAAKGYSITAAGTGTTPRHALYLGEAKVGCSPFNGAVRLAGTLELAGLDLSLNRQRLGAVAQAAADYLADWRPENPTLEWAGLRPLPPDGLPLIGRAPGHDGLFVATGHGMLGVTLAPSTGAALTPLVLEDRLVPELAPFGVDR